MRGRPSSRPTGSASAARNDFPGDLGKRIALYRFFLNTDDIPAFAAEGTGRRFIEKALQFAMHEVLALSHRAITDRAEMNILR